MAEPVITLKYFFDRVREGALTGIRCGKCGALAVPPREFCEACHQRAWEPVALSGEGTITSYTIIRVAPARHAADAPYAVAMVQLKEGVSLLGRIAGMPLDTLQVGLPVKFRPLTTKDQTTIGFGPV